ncbi:MAG: amino acid--tRNA ligase-related protein [Candidatus Woesearchaeota archaeon]
MNILNPAVSEVSIKIFTKFLMMRSSICLRIKIKYNITIMIYTYTNHLSKHNTFIKIKKIVSDFLTKNGYNEVIVPIISPALIPESYLEIFKTTFFHENKKKDYYLIPSPELFLKRLIPKIGSVFTITKSFRNKEPASSFHMPEFTMLEFYKINADYFDIANDVLSMFKEIAQKLYKKTTLMYQNKLVDLTNWEYITIESAFAKYAQIKNIFNKSTFFEEAEKRGYNTKGFSYTDVWSQIYTQEVEPNLGTNGRPTIVYEYPIELAALAEIDKKKLVAKRFECYIEGIELGNCAQETSGQSFNIEKKRFIHDLKERKKRGLEMHKEDYEFLHVVKNLPKCSGIAIGLDRLAMIFTNSKSIEELQLITFS